MVEVLAAFGITVAVFGSLSIAAVWQRLRKAPYRIENVCPDCHRKREAKLVKEGEK